MRFEPRKATEETESIESDAIPDRASWLPVNCGAFCTVERTSKAQGDFNLSLHDPLSFSEPFDLRASAAPRPLS